MNRALINYPIYSFHLPMEVYYPVMKINQYKISYEISVVIIERRIILLYFFKIFTSWRFYLRIGKEAYWEGYNDGLNQFGDIVTNPAGIDLTPQVAAELGFGYLESGYVSIYLNF